MYTSYLFATAPTSPFDQAVHDAVIDEVLPEKKEAPKPAAAAPQEPDGAAESVEVAAAAQPADTALAAQDAEFAEPDPEPAPEPDAEAQQAAYEATQLRAVDNAAGATVGLTGADGWKGTLNRNFECRRQDPHPRRRSVGCACALSSRCVPGQAHVEAGLSRFALVIKLVIKSTFPPGGSAHQQETMRSAWKTGKGLHPNARNVGADFARTHASPLAPMNGFYDQRYAGHDCNVDALVRRFVMSPHVSVHGTTPHI